MGLIEFYSGLNATGERVQVIEDTAGQDFRPVENPPIRSAKIFGVRPNSRISIYNGPTGSSEFCIVVVKAMIPEFWVGSFVRHSEDEFLWVRFYSENDTGQPVNRIKVD